MKSNIKNTSKKPKGRTKTSFSDTSVQVGKNLRFLRQLNGYSQSHIGHILGVSYQQIQKYEIGQNQIPMEKIAILKEYFGIPYEYFIQSNSQPFEKPKKQDRILSMFIYERISSVKHKKTREKIVKVVDLLCS